MKSSAIAFLAAGLLTSQSRATLILSQNFDADPVNYTHSPFAFQATDPTRYFGLSNAGMTLNAGVTGNATVFLAAQNMDADGDGSLTYSTGAPANVDFTVSVAGFTDIRLSIDAAGMPTVEVENYIRAFVDTNADGIYETPIFNFVGANNSAYIDATLGALSGTFATFGNISLPSPTDGIMRLRLEIFNDTQSLNEASGVDNILITGTVPEPGSVLLALAGGFCVLRRRRQ